MLIFLHVLPFVLFGMEQVSNIKGKSLNKYYVLYYQQTKKNNLGYYYRNLVIKKDQSGKKSAFDQQDYASYLKSLIITNSCTNYYEDASGSYYVCEVNPNIYKDTTIKKEVLDFDVQKSNIGKQSFKQDTNNFNHFRDEKIWEKLWKALPFWFKMNKSKLKYRTLQDIPTNRYIGYCIDKDGAKKVILFNGNNGLNDIDYSGYKNYIVNDQLTNGVATAYYVYQNMIYYALCPVNCAIIKNNTGAYLFKAIDLGVFKENLEKMSQELTFNKNFYKLIEQSKNNDSLKVKYMLLDALQYAFNDLESKKVSNSNPAGNEKIKTDDYLQKNKKPNNLITQSESVPSHQGPQRVQQKGILDYIYGFFQWLASFWPF